MTKSQHIMDILTRAAKSALAAYAAFVAAGGFNIIHVDTTVEVKIAALAAVATAILNVALKVHTAVVEAPVGSPALPTVVVPEIPLTPDEPTT